MSYTGSTRQASGKRKSRDTYYDTVDESYFIEVVRCFVDYGLIITPKRARQFLDDPTETVNEVADELGRPVAESEGEAADTVAGMETADSAAVLLGEGKGDEKEEEEEEEEDDRYLRFTTAADALDVDWSEVAIPDDFIALPLNVPLEVMSTIRARRLPPDPLPSAEIGISEPVLGETSVPTEMVPAFAALKEAQMAVSMVVAFEVGGDDRLSKPPREAPTFYGATEMGNPEVPGKRITQQTDRIGDFETYMDEDTVEEKTESGFNSDFAIKELRSDARQGPHTVAVAFTEVAFEKRLEIERTEYLEKNPPKDEMVNRVVAAWTALETVLSTSALLPYEFDDEIAASISLSRTVADTSVPGGKRLEKVDDKDREIFSKKLETVQARIKELYLQVDQAIQAGKSLALTARQAARSTEPVWNEQAFTDWADFNKKVYDASKKLLFEYKNMEPCATYVWNEWRGATDDELAGKGERKPKAVMAKYLLAGGGGTVEEAAREKWTAMLDLADHASKLIDGTSSLLDGETLWHHIEREVAMVEEDAPRLLTEMVQLARLFPSARLRGTKATREMREFEDAVKAGKITLPLLRDLLRGITDAGAFVRRPVADPLFPELQLSPDAVVDAEAEAEKFEERLRLLTEILKRRRARLLAEEAAKSKGKEKS
jgi:hypothetical protein